MIDEPLRHVVCALLLRRVLPFVVKPEVAAGKPPFDGSTQRGASAPAVRGAIAGAAPRVVNPLREAASHAGMLARIRASSGAISPGAVAA